MEVPEWIIMLVGRLALENEALRIAEAQRRAPQPVAPPPTA